MSLKVLLAELRSGRGNPRVALYPASGQKVEHDWADPASPGALLKALFGDGYHTLAGSAWQLRLQPERLPAGQWVLQQVNWWALRHPSFQAHLLDVGWTMTELFAVDAIHAEFDGTLLLLANGAVRDELWRALEGSKLLRERLRAGGDLRIDAVGSLDAYLRHPKRAQSIVIAHAASGDVAAIRQTVARRSKCRLIIWLDHTPPKDDTPIVEVFPSVDLAREDHQGARAAWIAEWIPHFIADLSRGVPPEHAFRVAGLGVKKQHRDLLRLRNATHRWSTLGPTRVSDPPEVAAHWGAIVGVVERLVAPAGPSRVAVVVSQDHDEGALRKLCRKKPPAVEASVEIWELGWYDTDDSQLMNLCRKAGVDEDEVLGELLLSDPPAALELAKEDFAAALGRHAHDLRFLWVQHGVGYFEGEDGAPEITAARLERYLRALVGMCSREFPDNVRLLLLLPLVTSPEAGEALQGVIEALARDETLVDTEWFTIARSLRDEGG